MHPTAPEIEGPPCLSHASPIFPTPSTSPSSSSLPLKVQAAVDDCLAKGIRAICVISAGFSECDAKGQRVKRQLLERVREAGCRLIGPNCMGLHKTERRAVSLNLPHDAALQDPLFGPLIACGTGGVLVDLLADSAFRLHPLTAPDAVEMIDQLKGARLLRGYRGAAPADEAALRDVLAQVSSW